MSERRLTLPTVILAGGAPTAVPPYRIPFPKPLVPLGDTPVLARTLDWLRRSGVRRAYLACGQDQPLIRALFSDGKSFGIRLSYLVERKPLGIAGAVAAVPETGDVLAVNGDTLTDFDLRILVDAHRAARADFTFAVGKREIPIDFGVARIGASGELEGYVERPSHSVTASVGIFVMGKRLRAAVPRGRFMRFPELVDFATTEGFRIRALDVGSDWLDIGRPDDYRKACERLDASKAGAL